MANVVTRVRKMGVEATMDSAPSGNYNIVRQSDSSVAGVVSFHKPSGTPGIYRMNWVGTAPTTPVQVGDTLVSV